MPYSAEISRDRPAAFIFLLDQSASMQDRFGGAKGKGDAAPSKARVLSDVMNTLLRDLVLRCAKEEGVRDYFHVGVIGYGDRVQPLVRPADGFAAAGDLIPISHLAERPLRMEERTQHTTEGRAQRVEQPVWFDPHAKNGTPMCHALDLATGKAEAWCDIHPESFPPIVCNVTDGEATDGDPLKYARRLKQAGTRDGDALLFNVHLSEIQKPASEFPADISALPDDEYARQLFQMSSVLPFPMRSAAEQEGYEPERDARGFVFNADPTALVHFLEIGTRPSTLR